MQEHSSRPDPSRHKPRLRVVAPRPAHLGRVAASVIRNPDLSAAAVLAYAAVRCKAGRSGVAIAPYGGWSAWLDCSERHARRAIGALVDAGVIVPERAGERLRYLAPNLPGQYARVDPDWLQLPTRTLTRRVFLVLATLAGTDGYCRRIGNARIAADCAAAVRTIELARTWLRRADLIRTDGRLTVIPALAPAPEAPGEGQRTLPYRPHLVA